MADRMLEIVPDFEKILYNPDGTERITLERLSDLVEADKEGRCVVLPCKVGSKAYTIEWDCRDNKDHNQLCFCYNRSCSKCDKSFKRVFENPTATENIRAIVENMGLCGECGGFGKTVFLTESEAQAALKGLGNNEK